MIPPSPPEGTPVSPSTKTPDPVLIPYSTITDFEGTPGYHFPDEASSRVASPLFPSDAYAQASQAFPQPIVLLPGASMRLGWSLGLSYEADAIAEGMEADLRFGLAFTRVNTDGAALTAGVRASGQGAPALTDGQFSFAAYDENGVQRATAVNRADGSIDFGSSLSFGYADVGTHLYTLKQTSASMVDWRLDDSERQIMLTVTFDPVAMSLSVAADPLDEPVFINTYLEEVAGGGATVAPLDSPAEASSSVPAHVAVSTGGRLGVASTGALVWLTVALAGLALVCAAWGLSARRRGRQESRR